MLVKINKNKARKLYADDKELMVIACKMAIGAPWHLECRIKKLPGIYQAGDFDSRINNFIYYNCNYEMGYYPHYYIEQ